MTDWLARARALQGPRDSGTMVTMVTMAPMGRPEDPIVTIGAIVPGYPNTRPGRDDQAGWRRYHTDLNRYWSRHSHLTVEQQRSLAWRETMHAWHLEHGERMPADRCAGCGGRLSDRSLTLPDGTVVHAGHGCLIAYGEAWQSRAAEALTAMGITAPGHDA